MKHIAMFSGGKDSTAMVLGMIKRGMKIDEIVCVDLGAEWPEMYAHISHFQEYISREITILRPPLGDFYYYFSDYELRKGRRKGEKGNGWCGKLRWGTGYKRDIARKYLRRLGEITEYHGVAQGEEKRLKKNKDGRNIKYPLMDWGASERQNLQDCYEKGFNFGGLYIKLCRVSCWCCDQKNIAELRFMYRERPEMWRKLNEMQSMTPYLYKGRGVAYYSERFEAENQIELF